jgi:hypothetical protein
MKEGKTFKNVKKAPKTPRPKIPPFGQKPKKPDFRKIGF